MIAPALVITIAAAIPLAGCGAGQPRPVRRAAAHLALPLDAPAQADPPAKAPLFALQDSLGRKVALFNFRGRAVLLTFIYDHCPDTCPLIVSKLHTALQMLGGKANEVQVIAVSVDPHGDTPATVRRFLAEHRMTGRMQYLIGSEAQLAPVWGAYGIAAKASPSGREVSHTALVYGITGSGRMLALYPSNFRPAWIAHDVPLLAVH
jgi:protein SCO1/2